MDAAAAAAGDVGLRCVPLHFLEGNVQAGVCSGGVVGTKVFLELGASLRKHDLQAQGVADGWWPRCGWRPRWWWWWW